MFVRILIVCWFSSPESQHFHSLCPFYSRFADGNQIGLERESLTWWKAHIGVYNLLTNPVIMSEILSSSRNKVFFLYSIFRCVFSTQLPVSKTIPRIQISIWLGVTLGNSFRVQCATLGLQDYSLGSATIYGLSRRPDFIFSASF